MPTLFRLLIGVFLLQGATAVQIIAALKSDQAELRLLFGAVAVALGVAAAFWFAAIAAAGRREALARAQQGFSREREKIQVKAERDKARLIDKAHRRLARERDRLQGRAGLKVGAAFAGVAGLGVLMLFTQFITVGLLTLTAGGGAAAGYLLRIRQERRRRDAPEPPLLPASGRPAITHEAAPRSGSDSGGGWL
jgi:uncharacterized protein YcfJ